MYYPNFGNFKKLARRGNLVPVYREILADLETPVSAYQKISDGSRYSFLLESVEGEEIIGRYSFLGADPAVVFRSKGTRGEIIKNGRTQKIKIPSGPLSALKKLLRLYRPVVSPGLPRFVGGAVGYLGYENINFWEKLPQRLPDDLKLPDCYFMITGTIVVFDRVRHTIKVVSNAHISGKDLKRAYNGALRKIEKIVKRLQKPLRPKPLEAAGAASLPGPKFRSNFKRADFIKAVRLAKEHIFAGDIFQVVLSQRLASSIKAGHFDVYRALRAVNPSPYLFYLKFGDLSLVGSSPEVMIRVENRQAILRPIAGTRPRGRDQTEDERLARELLSDEKEKAEHIMLVDLGRNDLGRVCQPGTVKVDELMTIEKYSHVMHIVSNVTGKLRPGLDSYDALRAAFPAGTVSGAPKVRAMEIISDLEKSCRGPYAGAVGYFSFSGNLDSAIVIRTIVIKGQTAYIQAGAGIVADSKPAREYQETLNKAKALLGAVEMAEKGLR